MTSSAPTADALDEQLRARLRDAGLKVTAQRVVLHRTLHGLGRHATADEVQRAAAADLPGLSLPTVYAGLELLADLGLASRVEAGGGAVRWDPRTDGHAHFACARCGAVIDVDGEPDAGPLLAAARRAGLAVDGVDVTLRGTCAACSAQPVAG
jgi:Fur family peroxide stress response transcriptional regulator